MPNGVLTIGDIEEAMRKMRAAMPVEPPLIRMRLIEDHNCLRQTDERLFPFSRHRSTRIRKKLIKRFGGEFRMEPAGPFVTPFGLVAHPVIAARLRAETRARR